MRWHRALPAWRTIRLAVSLVDAAGRGRLAVIVAATFVTSIAIAGELLVGRHLLNMLADSERTSAGELAPYLLLLGGLLVLAAIAQALSTELRIPLAEEVHRRTMEEILDVATEVDLEAYEGTDFADRLQRARMGASGQSAAIVFGLVTIISTLVVAAGVVAVLLTVAPILVPVAVLGYLPIAFVNVRKNRARYELERDLVEIGRERAYLEYLLTDRTDAKEIRSFEMAPTIRRWHASLWDLRLTRLRDLVRTRLMLSIGASTVTTTVLVGTLSIALILAGRGTITIGDAAVVVVGLQQLNNRLHSTGAAISGVHEGITFLRDFERFRDSLPEIRAARPDGMPPARPELLTVDRVGYRYPGSDRDAVRSVSFDLRRGQIMAVVGANGSGKSTLAKMLCGLLPPTRGVVAWDGVDLASCDPSRVREAIAPVFQDFSRFMLPIRHVIGLGDVDRIDDEPAIRAAADRAGVRDLIDALPGGLDARLGKTFTGGTDVSTGQWQRLAIARAYLRDASVIVLDEPSASLDPRAEAALFDLLHDLYHDRIVVFVSHRFATVRSADVVLVLDQGDVVEIGSHHELMAWGGLYRDLFELQASRYGLDDRR
jgi:ATP-binding cassette, subfamily B, bacterial